jgi:hypothetical protein
MANEILAFAGSEDCVLAGSISFELEFLDDFVHSGDYPQYLWIGALALRWSRPWGVSFTDHLRDIVDVVISKQHDYGTENIAKFGHHGLQVRMHDKVARLRNLTEKGTAARNEALEDTWRDLVGYSIVGLMWENDTFWLPLQSDRDEQAEDERGMPKLQRLLSEPTVLDDAVPELEILNCTLDDAVEAITQVVQGLIDSHVAQHHAKREPRLAHRIEKAYAADFAAMTAPDIEGRDVIVRPATYGPGAFDGVGYFNVESGGIELAAGEVVER